MKLYPTDGYYVPASFMLYVDTELPIDRLMGTGQEKVLTHELVHFLQDVCTTYGMANICKYVDSLKGLSKIVRETHALSVPIPASKKSDSANINADLFSIYVGDGTERYMTHNNTVQITSVTIIEVPVEGLSEPVNYVEIEYGKQERLHFGAMAIMESMAHIIEQKLYGDNLRKSYPYDSAALLAAYLYPDIENNVVAVLELCEASLMFLNPAEIFVEATKRLKEGSITYDKVGDYYMYVITNFSLEGINPIDYFSEISRQTQQQLDDLFTVNPFKDERWGSGVIKAGSKLREDRGSVASFLFGTGTDNPRDRLFKLISTIGFPPSFNNKHQAWVQNHPNSQHTQLMYPAISSILSLLEGKEEKCCLYDYCINEIDGYATNESCVKAPWKRASAKQPCHYAHVWKMWGHEKCEITPKKN